MKQSILSTAYQNLSFLKAFLWNLSSQDISQFWQGLIGNVKSRSIVHAEADLMHDIEAIIPEKWTSNNETSWIDGESSIIRVCKRFNVYSKVIESAFRDFFSNPRNVPREINDKLLQGFLNIIPISSAEEERSFSKMNLVTTKIKAY